METTSVFLLDNFGCKLLLTDLLQISHYIATKQLLFAQSESFYDDVEIRRASLSLLVVISKLCEYLAQHTIWVVSLHASYMCWDDM